MAAASSASGLTCRSSSSRPRCSCLRSCILPRRRWSMARCFAVAMSHAPGLSGTPDWGHCSSAATSASCARSSATPMSPTTRARPAMSLADSIRQTASMASATGCFRWRIHHRPDFDFQLLIPQSDVRFQKPARPFERDLLRRHVVDRETADDFFRLGERTVSHGDLAVFRQSGTRALGGRPEATHPHHHAFLTRLCAEAHDPVDELLGWQAALAAFYNRHESHGYFPERCLFFAMAARCRSSCWRSSGVNSAPKSSVSKNCRISTSPSWNGMRFAHSRASALFFTCQIQKPATSSLASVNGPSRTVRLLPVYAIRAPFDDGVKPSPASMMPALTSSSLNFPISASSCWVGMAPASYFWLPFTITRNRMADPLSLVLSVRRLIYTSNDPFRNRHRPSLLL